jgi:VWFA-related protein
VYDALCAFPDVRNGLGEAPFRQFRQLRSRGKRESLMKEKLLMLGIVLLLSIPAPVRAQLPRGQQGPPAPGGQSAGQPAPPIIRSKVNQVIVPVTVKGGQGQLVGDLQKDDFRVFADGIEQKILQFTSEPTPLSAVVLIDNDLAQKQAEQVQKSLTTISAGFGPNDEAALVTYSEYPTTVAEFSANNDELFTHLKRLQIGSHSASVNGGPTNSGPIINGNVSPTSAPASGMGLPIHGAERYQTYTDLDDALYAAADMFKNSQVNRRKIIFLISDGSNSRQNKHTFNETLRSLLNKDISVYSISVSHSVPTPVGKSIVEHGLAEIQKYATQTGGDAFYGAKEEELERLYADVTEEARNQFTLTFQPIGVDASHDYHPIEVRVRRPGLSILTREGYYDSGVGR